VGGCCAGDGEASAKRARASRWGALRELMMRLCGAVGIEGARACG
jgi:hypothetical protein